MSCLDFPLKEGVKKTFFLGLCPKHRTPPTHRPGLGLHSRGEKWKLSLLCFLGCLEHFIFSISPTEGGRGLGGLRSSPPSQGQVHRGAAEVDLDLTMGT